MNVPVSTPINKEEITSFINNAITMATKGGKIDIHRGMGPATGPKAYSSNMPNNKIMKMPNPICFVFIMRKIVRKITFFQSKDEKLSILALFLQPFSDLFTKYSNIKNLSL